MLSPEERSQNAGVGNGQSLAASEPSTIGHDTAGEPLSLVFRDIDYKVEVVKKIPFEEKPETTKKRIKKILHIKPKEKKTTQILQSLSGIFRPGRLTAIMGSSGAGKTSLLSILAGQIDSRNVDGQILINSQDFSAPGLMQRISGFVFQDDILLPTMTVNEAIQMSALLRLPKEVTKEERMRRVEEMVKILHLKKALNTKVGEPMKKGISGGERKRTSTQFV